MSELPPRLARRLLRSTVPVDDRADVLENMDVLFCRRSRRAGRPRAMLWYWWQALTFGVRLRLSFIAGEPTLRQAALECSVDVRLALRVARRSPLFALGVIATLGMGLGVNLIVFTIVNAAVLSPLPVSDADEVVWMWPAGDVAPTRAEFDELAPLVSTHAELTAFAYRNYSLQVEGDPRVVSGVSVTPDHFDVMNVEVSQGRSFRPEDGVEGAEGVALISDRLWRSYFGSDPAMLGSAVELFSAPLIPMRPGAFTGSPHRLIGVLPPGYDELFGGGIDVVTVLVREPSHWTHTAMGELTVLGRLAHGRSETDLEAMVRTVAAEGSALASLGTTAGDVAVPLRQQMLGPVQRLAALAAVAVAIVLLIASANVANLTLVRGRERHRELLVRQAIGAGRGRIVRHLLAENAVFAGIALVLAIVVSRAAMPLATGLLPAQVRLRGPLSVDPTVMLFCAGLLVTTIVASGLVPALLVSKGSFGLRGTAGTGGPGRGEVSKLLAGGQIALALALTYSAGLLTKSFISLSAIDPGFAAEDVTVVRLAPTSTRYASAEERRSLVSRFMERVAAVPGVSSVGAIHFLPVADAGPVINFLLDPADPESRHSSGYRVITPGYFETMEIPLLEGRDLGPLDRVGSPPVGLVNRRLAELIWPGQSAIGRTIHRTNGDVMMEVVGVVADVYQLGVATPPGPEIYLPLDQSEWASVMNVVVKAEEGLQLQPVLRTIASDVDTSVPITREATMSQVISDSVRTPRLLPIVFGAFALLGVMVGAVGVFAVMSAMVGSRTAEIGIRMALGGNRLDILMSELRQGAIILVWGCAAGSLLAWLGGRLLAGFLHEVSYRDPVVAVFTLAIIGVAATVAVLIPARRASRVHPTSAIRGAV